MIIGLDISVLNDRQRTGIAVYTYNLIDSLLKINKKVDKFVLFGIATFETYDWLKNLPFKNYPNVEIKIYRMPARFFRIAFLLWQKLNWPPIENFVGKVDIFHSFNWYLPPQRHGRVVATVFDLTSIIQPEWHHPKTTQLDKVRIQKLAKDADCIITISKNSKKDFKKIYPETRVEVVYPGVSSNFTNRINVNETKEVLKKYSLKPGYFLSVSTLEPRKNLKTLIRVYLDTKLRQKFVLVGGSGWKNQEIIKLLNKHRDRIISLGFVPDTDLVILYQQALCFLYPSFYEGFGIPILEAMSCGTPVICSNTSSLPEAGGDAVLYIDPNKDESISKALVAIEKDKDLRDKLSWKGLKQIKNFSWEKSAKRLLSLYHAFGQP